MEGLVPASEEFEQLHRESISQSDLPGSWWSRRIPSEASPSRFVQAEGHYRSGGKGGLSDGGLAGYLMIGNRHVWGGRMNKL